MDSQSTVVSIGVTEHIVEQRVAFAPQTEIFATHVLERVAYVHVMLKELRRQSDVTRILFGQLQRHAHHVQAIHTHPTCCIRLLQCCPIRWRLTSVEDGDVVESEKAAFEDIVAFAIDLVHPPRKVDQEFVKTLF